jgi:hypothetical protein
MSSLALRVGLGLVAGVALTLCAIGCIWLVTTDFSK